MISAGEPHGRWRRRRDFLPIRLVDAATAISFDDRSRRAARHSCRLETRQRSGSWTEIWSPGDATSGIVIGRVLFAVVAMAGGTQDERERDRASEHRYGLAAR